MNWYKLAVFDIQDLSDRSVVSNNIRFLEAAIERLVRITKLVFQNAVLARGINGQIMSHKKLSSYPHIRDLLIAADRAALDSPWKFAEFCALAADEMNVRIATMKKEREEFTEDTLPKRMKGFVDERQTITF